MELFWQFIRDNWLLVTGGLGAFLAVVLIPAIRGVAWKALQLAIANLGKAFMSMLTAEFFTKATIWVLEKLAEKTAGTWDDELVEKLKEQLKNK